MQLNRIRHRFSLAQGEVRAQAIALHRQRYQSIGFMPEGFLDPYEREAVYFVARDEHDAQVLAVCRLVAQPLARLATCAHFDLFPPERQAMEAWNAGSYVELGAFTKRPGHHDIVPGLISTALTYAFDQGATRLLCCIDERFFDKLRTFLDLPLRVIGTPAVFQGSLKVPCQLDIAEGLQRLRQRTPWLFATDAAASHDQAA